MMTEGLESVISRVNKGDGEEHSITKRDEKDDGHVRGERERRGTVAEKKEGKYGVK